MKISIITPISDVQTEPLPFFLSLTADYPDPPLNLEVISGPDMTSATIIWDPPSISSNTVVLRPLDSFEVWVRLADEDDYQTLASVDSNVHRVNVTGLHPGTFYWMVVASINTAGSSLSNTINITTLPSGM